VAAAGGGSVLTLNQPLSKAHPAGSWVGTEFVRYIWYPDVALDNIFWHDHVDGIHNWGHGLISQLIIEPPGSTYHDPTTGAQVDSGSLVDIRTSSPLIPGVVDGSFREVALWSNEEAVAGLGAFNMRAEPLLARTGVNADQSLILSSFTHGDPVTPLPRAYAGDPVVIRHMSVSPAGGTLVVDGHTFRSDTRLPGSEQTNAVVHGVSDRFTLALTGGAGGPLGQSGDFLYRNGSGQRFVNGAWGILRVLDRQTPDLQPLPGTSPAPGPAQLPQPTGGRPPDAGGNPGDPCPTSAPRRAFGVSAVNLRATPVDPALPEPVPAVTATYVPTIKAAAVKGGLIQPEPLVLHAAVGDCVEVTLKNELAGGRASFHAGKLARSNRSSGVNVGYNVEQTVAPGESRLYRLYADDASLGAALVSDFGARGTGATGMYGAIVVAPRGALFRDPVTGLYEDVGVQIDVSAPGQPPYRDLTAILMDDEAEIGQNIMPYPKYVAGAAFFNHRSVTLPITQLDTAGELSKGLVGDPVTALYRAHAGDRTVVHALGGPGSKQVHSFSVGGHAWHRDPAVPASEIVTADLLGAETTLDADLIGGAGGGAKAVGDHFVGDLRRPFTNAGMWGLLRTLSPGDPSLVALSAPFPGGRVALASIDRISNLRVPKRLSLQNLHGKGLRGSLRGPASLGTITIKLGKGKKTLTSRAIKQGAPKRFVTKKVRVKVKVRVKGKLVTKVKTVTRKVRVKRIPSYLTVRADGFAVISWRVAPRVVARLKPGKHLVSVVWRGQTLQAPITLFDAAKKKPKKTKAKKTKPKAKKTTK
jgi:hypothetical protein